MAQWLEDYASATLRALASAEKTASNRDAAEYRRMVIDAYLEAGIGRFFGTKFRSAVLYRIYEKTGDRGALEEALNAVPGRLAAFWLIWRYGQNLSTCLTLLLVSIRSCGVIGSIVCPPWNGTLMQSRRSSQMLNRTNGDVAAGVEVKHLPVRSGRSSLVATHRQRISSPARHSTYRSRSHSVRIGSSCIIGM